MRFQISILPYSLMSVAPSDVVLGVTHSRMRHENLSPTPQRPSAYRVFGNEIASFVWNREKAPS